MPQPNATWFAFPGIAHLTALSAHSQRGCKNLSNDVQFGFGLQLASDVPVPGAITRHCHEMRFSIAIELIGQCQPSPEPGFMLEADGIVYSHPCGRFHCAKDRITIEPSERASGADLGELLVANALPALLWQRGAFVLHAACVQIPDGPAVAIAGPSGAGKSRLAAALVAGGAQLIGDDSLALYPENHGVLAQGLPGGLFARSPDSADREFVRAEAGPAQGECVLDFLVILTGEECSAQRLAPIEAVEQLLLNRHRPQVPLLLGQQGRVLTQTTMIAGQLPIVCIGPQALFDNDPNAISTFLTDLARPSSCGSRLFRDGNGSH